MKSSPKVSISRCQQHCALVILSAWPCLVQKLSSSLPKLDFSVEAHENLQFPHPKSEEENPKDQIE